MKPAKQTISGVNPASVRSSSASNASRDGNSLWSTTAVGIPARSATARAPAFGRFETTATISAG